MSQQQNTGEKEQGRKIVNKSFETVVKFKYLGLTLTTFYSQKNEVKGNGKVVLVQPQRHTHTHTQEVGLQYHLFLIW